MKKNRLQPVAVWSCVVGALLVLPGAPAQSPASAVNAANPEPAFGVYRGADATVAVDAYAAWLGRDAIWALDTIGWESWDNIGWPTFWLEAWSKWVKARPGRRLVLTVPMLTGPPDGSGPIQGSKGLRVPVSLEEGAAGAYNSYYHDLAANLVRYGLAGTILRPGWEFNGDWYAWRAKGKTGAYAEYWRQIVMTMRAVSGAEQLKFCWNPTLGDQQFPADQAWPGDEFVDYVGLDVYDETWYPDTYPWPADASPAEIERRQRKAWEDWIMNSSRGLVFWTKFAQAHHKPLAIPEWGLSAADHHHGGLDDPYFIEQMHAFIMNPANGVAFDLYFDSNEPALRHQLSPDPQEAAPEFPRSAARFRQLFGKAP
jgi:hypothetical protein